MIFNDMSWRPDMILYVAALVALLAGIDGGLFILSQEKQYADHVSVSLSVLDNFSASDWSKVGDVARCR